MTPTIISERGVTDNSIGRADPTTERRGKKILGRRRHRLAGWGTGRHHKQISIVGGATTTTITHSLGSLFLNYRRQTTSYSTQSAPAIPSNQIPLATDSKKSQCSPHRVGSFSGPRQESDDAPRSEPPLPVAQQKLRIALRTHRLSPAG